MVADKRTARLPKARTKAQPVRLKDVAQFLGVSPATVSLILNRAPAAAAIPEETHRRVRAAAKSLGYRPNQLARSLRSNRTQTIGVLVPEISEGYEAAVLAGIEEQLHKENYFYFVASHTSDPERMRFALQTFEDRQVEGLILANTNLPSDTNVPTVRISGDAKRTVGASVVLDHDHAAKLALDHLWQLGHRDVAFFRGPVDSADSGVRWKAIVRYARTLGLPIRENLVRRLGELKSDHSGAAREHFRDVEVGYAEGYECAADLLSSLVPFTALFSFNDLSAIGAARAFAESNRYVPQDISLVGFDDILSASFHTPPLTTVRQPLREMGRLAAKTLLAAVRGEQEAEAGAQTVEPQLMIRRSTATPLRRL